MFHALRYVRSLGIRKLLLFSFAISLQSELSRALRPGSFYCFHPPLTVMRHYFLSLSSVSLFFFFSIITKIYI